MGCSRRINPVGHSYSSLEYSVSNTLPYDNACGGKRSTNQEIVDQIPSKYTPNKYTSNPENSFIPTVSALDINTSNLFYNISNDPNILTMTPFDQIYYSDSNEEHIHISVQTKMNLLNEITNSNFPPYAASVTPTTNNVGSVKADTPIMGSFTIMNTGAERIDLEIASPQWGVNLEGQSANHIVNKILMPGWSATINYSGTICADYGHLHKPLRLMIMHIISIRHIQ